MSEEKLEQAYKKAARVIVKAGVFPFPINDTMIKILKFLIKPEELDFVMGFKRRQSQTMEELIKSSKLPEEKIAQYASSLAKHGLIFNQPNSKGVMVYRLMPLVMVGAFEYSFMKKINYTEEEKELAKLFAQMFDELSDFVQDGYENISPLFKNMLPFDRTMPILGEGVSGKELEIKVNEELDVPEETVLATQKVEELINKFDEIAVGHCFCRHHHDLLGDPCKTTDLRENCFTFGKSARYCVEQDFARMVSKEEALEIMRQSEKDGLIHKAFHPGSNFQRDETSICNCCKCCCGTLEWWRNGVSAMINSTNYLSEINPGLCIGCGTCVERCPVDAIKLNDENKAEREESYCIGCGICAHFCPEGAISLIKGPRSVFVPVPKLR